MEVVIDGDARVRPSVDAMHVSLEVLPVVAAVQEIVCGEQIGVDHLVLHIRPISIADEQCVHGVGATSEREQRLRETDRDPQTLHAAESRAQRHPLAPLHVDRLQTAVEERLVKQLGSRDPQRLPRTGAGRSELGPAAPTVEKAHHLGSFSAIEFGSNTYI